MLVLSRQEGERIVIGRDIVITVIEAAAGRARLAITAPEGTPVLREEVFERMARQEPGDVPEQSRGESHFYAECG